MHLPRRAHAPRAPYPSPLWWLPWLLLACEPLPRVPPGVCGNRVVEGDEECDTFPTDRCHEPGSDFECRIDCRKQPCAPGSACGVDAVCRTPAGRFTATRVEAGYALELKRGDLNGDGRDDLLSVEGRTTSIVFNGKREDQTIENAAVGRQDFVVGELNGDGQADALQLASGQPAVKVLESDATFTLFPVANIAPAPAGGTTRLLAADLNGDGRQAPLLLVDDALYPVVTFLDRFSVLLKSDVPADEVAGHIPVGDFFPESPCDEFALARMGTREVHVYTLCTAPEPGATQLGPPAKLAQVELPEGYYVSLEGAFVGDVNGDGRPDLLISALPEVPPELDATPSYQVFVSYGVADGFHDEPLPDGPGNQRVAERPLEFPSALLAVADVDGDGKADYVLEDRLMFSTRFVPGCERREDTRCARVHSDEPWSAAVVADFNRDDVPDVVGVPLYQRQLYFWLGLGGSAFNEFPIATDGLPTEGLYARQRLAVGDYDGDRVTDLAFTAFTGTYDAPRHTLNVLFGQPLGTPFEQRRVGEVSDIQELCAGNLFTSANEVTDLIMVGAKGTNGKGQGVGLFAGQTNRLLFSPLPVPEQAETRDRLTLDAVALGHFKRPRVLENERAPRSDLSMVARSARGGALVYFLDNGRTGFDATASGRDRLRLEGTGQENVLRAVALDLDVDGIDELVIYGDRVVGGRLRYWVVRRSAQGIKAEAFGTSIEGTQGRVFSVAHVSPVRDVDADGLPDLALTLVADESGDVASVLALLRGAPRTRFAPALRLGGELSGWYDFAEAAFLNFDADPALEVVVNGEQGLELFDIGPDTRALSRALTSVRVLANGYFSQLLVGDFDGNGVDDLAGASDGIQMFWGEARRP